MASTNTVSMSFTGWVSDVVTLRMLEEASGAEVAETLELPAGHVAVLLHRAKRELLRCMMT